MSDTTHGCHCDLEPGQKPDGCVFDSDTICDCVHAMKLHADGKGKADCEYWRPLRPARTAPTLTDEEPLAWGVVPGGDLPLWRCRSREQAEAVRVWLEQQRPGSEPEVVPLVDGRVQATLTDAEREALEWAKRFASLADCNGQRLAALSGLLARHGGER